MNKIFLWVISKLAPFWTFLGVDAHQLYLILNIKLELSGRRPISINPNKKIKNLNVPNWLRELIRVLLTSLTGLIYCIFLFLPDREIGLLYATFMYFLLACLFLIITLSNQLIDTSDNIILLPRPINNKTLVLYRLLYGGFKFCMNCLPLSLPLTITIMVQTGFFNGLYFFVLLIPGLCLVFALMQMLILLLLRIFSIRFFSKLIFVLQAFMVISIYASFQGSFISKIQVTDLKFTLGYSHALSFMMPYWIVEIWFHKAPIFMHVALWSIPALCMIFIIRFLAPYYSSKLSELSTESRKKVSVKRLKASFIKPRFLFLKNPASRASFLFTKKLIIRSKDFKLKILPTMYQVAITTVPVAIEVWNFFTKGDATFKESKFIPPIYVLLYPLIIGFSSMVASSDYKASWVYFAAPDSTTGQIKLGAGWAVVRIVFIPAFLIWSTLALIITRGGFWSNLLLAFTNVILVALVYIHFALKDLPASVSAEDFQERKKSSQLLILGVFVVALGIGFIHAFLFTKLFWWIQVLISAINLAAIWMLWNKIASTKVQ